MNNSGHDTEYKVADKINNMMVVRVVAGFLNIPVGFFSIFVTSRYYTVGFIFAGDRSRTGENSEGECH